MILLLLYLGRFVLLIVLENIFKQLQNYSNNGFNWFPRGRTFKLFGCLLGVCSVSPHCYKFKAIFF